MTLCTSCPDCPPGLAMHLKTAAGGETHRVGGKLVPCFLSMMIILLDREHARVSWFSSSHQDVERGNGRRCVHTVDVVVRLGADWERYIVVNPFAGAAQSKMVHLYLSRDPVKPGVAEALRRRARSGERIKLTGGALWIDYGSEGVHHSKLSASIIDQACGSPTTGRNWNSVMKIHEMIAARGQGI